MGHLTIQPDNLPGYVLAISSGSTPIRSGSTPVKTGTDAASLGSDAERQVMGQSRAGTKFTGENSLATMISGRNHSVALEPMA